jgi:signal transduction histidine kinase
MSQSAGGRPPSAYPAYPGSDQVPAPARPPLTKRMRPVHWLVLDCAVAGFLALFSAAGIGPHIAAGRGRLPVAVLFMAVVFTPVALRRRAPVTAFGALLILGVLLSSLPRGNLPPPVLAVIFLAAAFVLYTVTVESRRRTGAAALGLMLAVVVFLVGAGGPGQSRADRASLLVPVALANVIAWMTGYSVRQRRLYVVTLQQRAASSAVAEERLRIARELHDVVAHSMSVIAVQAGYGQYVIDTSPGGAKDALGAIQATSRDALEEMRRMLGVLRQQDGAPAAGNGPADIAPVLGLVPPGGQPAGGGSAQAGQAPAGQAPPRQSPPRQSPLAPAPGLGSLGRLIERTRGAGLVVALEVTGHPRPAPAGVDLSAYRIIQEALTNVVKHAGTGASCIVIVCYTDAELVIRVTDDGGLPVALPSVSVASAGSGHGIIGMRERVHLCGGTFNAGRLRDGGFQVMASLPLPLGDPRDPRTPRGPSGPASLIPPGTGLAAAGFPGAVPAAAVHGEGRG